MRVGDRAKTGLAQLARLCSWGDLSTLLAAITTTVASSDSLTTRMQNAVTGAHPLSRSHAEIETVLQKMIPNPESCKAVYRHKYRAALIEHIRGDHSGALTKHNRWPAQASARREVTFRWPEERRARPSCESTAREQGDTAWDFNVSETFYTNLSTVGAVYTHLLLLPETMYTTFGLGLSMSKQS